MKIIQNFNDAQRLYLVFKTSVQVSHHPISLGVCIPPFTLSLFLFNQRCLFGRAAACDATFRNDVK